VSGPGRRNGDEEARRSQLERVVFFSDAVFAIAMTVLALSIHIPAGTKDADVGDALRKVVPSVLTYLLSFSVIGLYWLAHHRMYRYFERVDATMLALNLASLSVVAFVPFPTQVLGEHGGTTAAVVLYAATVGVLGSVVTVSWIYATQNHRLIAPETPNRFVQHQLWRSLVVPAVFLVSIPIAFLDPSVAEWWWSLIIVGRITLRRRYGPISQ
jgi:uncharacterized membrane protein